MPRNKFSSFGNLFGKTRDKKRVVPKDGTDDEELDRRRAKKTHLDAQIKPPMLSSDAKGHAMLHHLVKNGDVLNNNDILSLPETSGNNNEKEVIIKVKYTSTLLSKVKAGFSKVLQLFDRLIGRNGKKYTIDQKEMVVRLVISNTMTELLGKEGEYYESIAHQYEICKKNLENIINESPETTSAYSENDIPKDEQLDVKKSLIKNAIKAAEEFKITPKLVNTWVENMVEHGSVNNPNDNPKVIHSINTNYKGKLSMAAALELQYYYTDRANRGIATNYIMLQTHLQGTERIHPVLTINEVPAESLKYDCIRRGMQAYGLCASGIQTYVGKKKKAFGGEALQKRLWRLRVWWAEMAINWILQDEGKVMVFQFDESFIHKLHHAKYGLNSIDAKGNQQNEIEGAVGVGERLCICGGICALVKLVVTWLPKLIQCIIIILVLLILMNVHICFLDLVNI
jgi:hypothetical protein